MDLPAGDPVTAMLDAASVAVVGASPRPGSFGHRMVIEALRGPATVHPVNPRYPRIEGRACAASLAELGEAPDLVLLGVGDRAVEQQLLDAAGIGARSAVVFGSVPAPGLRERLAEIAAEAGMALCGGGCMGFVNVATGLRAVGYLERDPLPAGPVTLITHSGSVFSAMLRTRRAIGYSLAVSSGQELVTTAAQYLGYALDQRPGDAVIALVLETVRDAAQLRLQLRRAAELDVPVILLPVGGSAAGSRLVKAHSGALAGDGAMWEALCEDTGALPVTDLAELTDTLELVALGRRRRPRAGSGTAAPQGIALVHDSGAERALTADLADRLGVRFARISSATKESLRAVLDEGLTAENPLDVWGTGAGTRELFTRCLVAMAGDPDTGATVLAVDLVPEYDGDTAYPDAVLAATELAGHGAGPIAVLTGLPSAIDQEAAARLRRNGVAVLEGTRSGLIALRNLLQLQQSLRSPGSGPESAQPGRRARWRTRLSCGVPLDGAESFQLLRDYGVPTSSVLPARDLDQAVKAAAALGYPVVLKTDQPGIEHKSEASGVLLGIGEEAQLRSAYQDLSARLGPAVLICSAAEPGPELSIGMTRDPHLGPMLVLAAGGTMAELIADRVVTLPPVSPDRAGELLARLRISALLNGFRGAPAADRNALRATVAAVSVLAADLGDLLDGLDVNPVIASPAGPVAVDVLVQLSERISAQKMA